MSQTQVVHGEGKVRGSAGIARQTTLDAAAARGSKDDLLLQSAVTKIAWLSIVSSGNHG
jgi:hypothetical protein